MYELKPRVYPHDYYFHPYSNTAFVHPGPSNRTWLWAAQNAFDEKGRRFRKPVGHRPTPSAVLVDAAIVHPSTVSDRLQATGIIQANQEVQLVSEVAVYDYQTATINLDRAVDRFTY
jgi:hypothetical protein